MIRQYCKTTEIPTAGYQLFSTLPGFNKLADIYECEGDDPAIILQFKTEFLKMLIYLKQWKGWKKIKHSPALKKLNKAITEELPKDKKDRKKLQKNTRSTVHRYKKQMSSVTKANKKAAKKGEPMTEYPDAPWEAYMDVVPAEPSEWSRLITTLASFYLL